LLGKQPQPESVAVPLLIWQETLLGSVEAASMPRGSPAVRVRAQVKRV
jgi:hypothetical protein